ncbi:hypothetical protein DAEQUDRAFT_725355, partial [Daedalea quercina L-15889]
MPPVLSTRGLRLAWAVTAPKSQGLMPDRACIGLGSREFCLGLTFVALSRACMLKSLMLLDKIDYTSVRSLEGKVLEQWLEDWRR